MSNSRTARAQIKELALASENNPSFYFVHGFFVGLAINPKLIPPSNWLHHVFINLDLYAETQISNMDGLMWQYNEVMHQCMEGTIKLPVQCKLSPTDIEGSLIADAPLPQWCEGLLAGLKLIDKRSISKAQKAVLKQSTSAFADFTSHAKLKARLGDFGEKWQDIALAMRRTMVNDIDHLLAELRFAVGHPLDDASLTPLPGPEDDEYSELEEMLNFALYSDSTEAKTMLEGLIVSFEKQQGNAYFTENTGHFWLMHETRPYMSLRARRARLKFEKGELAAAIAELQALLVLNPNDNQALRYTLASWLAIAGDWNALAELFAAYPAESAAPMLASQALMLFAQQGDSVTAKAAKKTMHQANKHLIKYLTGQKKMKAPPEYFSLGEASEAEMYIQEYGKHAWRSVAGALFWLRKS